MSDRSFDGIVRARDLVGGILISARTPFDEAGAVLYESITFQVKRLARINGILGIAVNTTEQEGPTLTFDECIEVVRNTRAALRPDQLLLARVEELSEAAIKYVRDCQTVGANAVILSPAKWQTDCEGTDHDDCLTTLVNMAERLALPIIFALGSGKTRWARQSGEITALAKSSNKVLGFEMGSDENVLQYDQDYYALKSLDRPVACLPSSAGTLFHNLNTGGDGVVSCLAFVAPHEVSELFQASRNGCFAEAQAIHNRLAPLVALLHGHDAATRELLYREAAYYRGILGSPHAHGLTKQLNPNLSNRLHKIISDIGLKPIA